AWRSGRAPRIEDYLAQADEDDRSALREELLALEQELGQLGQAGAPSDAGPLPTIAEAPTIAPGMAPTLPLPDAAAAGVHEQATRPPGELVEEPRIRGAGFLPASEMPTGRMPEALDTAVVIGQTTLAQADGISPTLIRYVGDYEIVREIAR